MNQEPELDYCPHCEAKLEYDAPELHCPNCAWLADDEYAMRYEQSHGYESGERHA